MAEGARLESVFTRKGNVGSNPTLSASTFVIRHLHSGETTLIPRTSGRITMADREVNPTKRVRTTRGLCPLEDL